MNKKEALQTSMDCLTLLIPVLTESSIKDSDKEILRDSMLSLLKLQLNLLSETMSYDYFVGDIDA